MADEQVPAAGEDQQQTDDQQQDQQTDQGAENQQQEGQTTEQQDQNDDAGAQQQTQDDGYYLPHRDARVSGDEVYEEWKRSQDYIRKLESERKGPKANQSTGELEATPDELKALKAALGADEESIRAAAREELQRQEQLREADRQISEQTKECQELFTGKDDMADMPKFDKDEAMAYAVQHGYRNLKDAWIAKHQAQWVEHLVNQKVNKSAPAPQTDRTDAPDAPEKPDRTKMIQEIRAAQGDEDTIHAILRKYSPTRSE